MYKEEEKIRSDFVSANLTTFYKTSSELQHGIIEFVHQGIDANEGVIIIATQSTRTYLENDLVIYYELQKQSDNLIILDAESMLAMFMKDKMPDKKLFDKAVGRLVERFFLKKSKVRVYGEMINILWSKGQHEAAITLEKLWNDLIKHHSFTLSHGYLAD